MAEPGRDFLKEICQDTIKDVAGRKVRRPQSLLDERVGSAPPVRPFVDAIVGDEVAVIAEFKRVSPSRGVIREDADPGEIGRIYGNSGASAMSVLTNSTYFQGRERDLVVARSHNHLPILRKDFILDAYQIDEARSVGADAILLIA
ncbi:MAG: indole-3-glycerol-phosphate synthase TrpC, partial [Candidatus Latescibacteria bacterium]|nr:indole-3-glycerol-phosphate synthase TrpC [Candidatus Latescibacterota bacterium]